MVDSAEIIWRDYTTMGVPGSLPHDPEKARIREWAAWVESIITAFLSSGGLIYDTRASLNADLAHGPNSMAWVVADSTAANNGIYRKSGASGTGSWTRVADLPYSFVRLNDVGAGTANAIQLTSSIPTSQSVLRVANVFEANAGNVTISENGAAAKSLLTSSGNQIPAAGLTAGMMITYVDDGTSFRLLTDYASAAIVAAAEAAQQAAEDARDAALGAVPNAFAPTRTVLKGYNTATITNAGLLEAGRVGQFTWDSSDLSATMVVKSVTSTSYNATTDVVTKVAHGLILGDVVIGTATVSGITANTKMWVSRIDADTFKLYNSFANAVANGATGRIDLTGSTQFTLQHLLDPEEGFFVTKTGAALNGSAGAWKRTAGVFLDIRMCGAVASGNTADAMANTAAALATKTLAAGVGLAGFAIVEGDGYYSLNAGINLGGDNLEIQGVGRPELRMVGSFEGLKFGPNEGSYIQNFKASNLKVVGSPTITYAVVFDRLVQGCKIENIEARECTHNGFRILDGVATVYDTLMCSTNFGAMTTIPTYGVFISSDTASYTADCTFINPIIEGLTGSIGLTFDKARGCHVLGGTSEANGYGIDVSSNCDNLKFDSIWCEQNGISDISDFGIGSVYINCRAQSAGSGNTVEFGGHGTKVVGGIMRVVNLQATGADWDFDSVRLSDHPSLGFIGAGFGGMTRRNCFKIDTNGNISARFTDISRPGAIDLLGVGTDAASTRSLNVRGPGATSATHGLHVTNSSGLVILRTRDDGILFSEATYALTNAAPADVIIGSDGSFARSTSALKYKDVEGPIEDWMLDAYKQLSGFLYRQKGDKDGRLFVGMAADHFHDAGLTMLVSYGENGEVEGLHYERLIAFEREINRRMEDRIVALEKAILKGK